MKKFKKVLALVLSIAMVLGMSSISFAEGEEVTTLPDVVLDGGEEGGSSMIGTYTAPTSRGQATDAYKYMGYASLLDAVPDTTIADGNYRYLVMTYTGDITQLRFEFTRVGTAGDGSDDEKEGPYWFNPEGQTYYFVTADESPIPLVGDNTTIVIDLAKSVNPNSLDGSGLGVGIDWYNSGIHMHCDEMVTHGEGAGYTISNAYLTTTLPVIEEPEETTEAVTEESGEEITTEEVSTEESTEEPAIPILDKLILGGSGEGISSMIGTYTPPTSNGEATDSYKFLGYVSFLDMVPDLSIEEGNYRYLVMTYTGDITQLRFQFVRIGATGDGSDDQLEGPFWFNPESQDGFCFVTADGSDIPLVGNDTTVVIDLGVSGVDMSWYNDGLHMHCDQMVTYGNGEGITISDAYLTNKIPGTEETSTEITTEVTTEAPVVLPDEIVLDGVDGECSFVGEYTAGNTAGYKYLGYVKTKSATSDYKYLEIKYTGDISTLRLEFNREDDTNDCLTWFASNQAAHFITADGSDIVLVAENETECVIDLEASGIDIGEFVGFHMHYLDQDLTGGGFNIIDARLTKTTDVLPNEIILDGNEEGASSLIGTYSGTSTGYKYLGYATFKGATDAYKYLQLTYTGDITMLRYQFVHDASGDEEEFSDPFWFDSAFDTRFVTADGSAIPLVGDDTTIVIDLEASGVDMSWYNSGVHMHTEDLATRGDIVISNAVLSKTLPTVDEESTVGATEESTEGTTEAPVVLPEEIVLDGEDGVSSFIGEYVGGNSTGYKYLGYVTTKSATSDYKYLKIKYTGDISTLRLEFNREDDTNDCLTWFDSNQAAHFVTADGSDIVLVAENETECVIDLEASGIDIGEFVGFHMHYLDQDIASEGFSIIDARLLKTIDFVTSGTIIVEAEDYTASEGVSVKTVADAELVYTIHENDWMEYTIDVPADGYYRFNVVAGKSYRSTGKVALRNADDYVIAESTIYCTGGWDACLEFTGSLVYLKAGVQTVTLYAVDGGYNVDSFSLVPEDSLGTADNVIRVEAEAYDSASGIEVTKRAENDTAVVYKVHDGDYMVYTVDVEEAGNYTFFAFAAKAYGLPTSFELTDGTNVLASAKISSTGSWYDYQMFVGSTVALEAGTHTFYIEAAGGNNNLDFFGFVAE